MVVVLLKKGEARAKVEVRRNLIPSHLGSDVEVVRNMSKIDEVWALLQEGKGQSAYDIARKASLPTKCVNDILLFFARYGFAEIEIRKNGVTRVRPCEDVPPILVAIRIIKELALSPDQTSTITTLD